MPVRPLPTPRVALVPDDDVAIGTALAARAALLVTGDRSLLSVPRHEGVEIVRVSEAIAMVELGKGA